MSAPIATADTYRFGSFVLDTHRGTLSRGDTAIYLRPKAYALLVHLAQNMGRVVPKSELMDAVWPGIYVTEDSLTQSIREIRKAFGDPEQDQLRTVSRRGYMLNMAPRRFGQAGLNKPQLRARDWLASIAPVTTSSSTSAIGAAIQIPFSPSSVGSANVSGMAKT